MIIQSVTFKEDIVPDFDIRGMYKALLKGGNVLHFISSV
jgi:hypothetical protein